MDSISHGNPNKWTGKIAAVRDVMAGAMRCGSMLKVSGSMSTKTGRQPAFTIAPAVAKNVKAGAKAIKYHLDYMAWLLDHRRWLAGDVMTLADFAGAAHLSALDYISDVDWTRVQGVRDWYAKIKSRPAFRTLLADQVPGFPQPDHYADLDF